MEIKVLHPNEFLSNEELVNVKGGLNAPVLDAAGCVCDCIAGNKNTSTPPPTKPTKPTTTIDLF